MKEYFKKINQAKQIIFICLVLNVTGLSLRAQTSLFFNLEKTNNLQCELADDNTYQFITKGGDPYVFIKPLKNDLPTTQTVLSFEYFCPKGLNHLQIFFKPDEDENYSKQIKSVGMSEGWVQFSVDLTEYLQRWGKAGDDLRLDFGGKPNVNLQIRNLVFREMSEREKEINAGKAAKKKQEALVEQHLKKYLAADFVAQVSKVVVSESTVKVEGTAIGANPVYLCEIRPYMDVTEEKQFSNRKQVSNGEFTVSLNRFDEQSSITYDRLLSKWVLAEESGDSLVVISHAHYADEVEAKYKLPLEKATSKKGLGGFSTGRGHTEDLEDLDITSATVNMWITNFMYTQPAEDRIKHTYNGRDWYFGEKQVNQFDKTFRLTAEKNIVTAAILLISKAEQCPDPEIGRLLQHPDMDPAGIYSMPNMTNPESVECYAAALDFLASRYSREDKKYGRINHWIMHNEVDAGWVWTNMGDKNETVFMDTYIKSMRMCYNIARSYNPHSEVFITLTHYWAWTPNPRFYPSKNLLELLIDYTHTEGDFEWAVAQHPYPESLFEPKTWLDQKVDFTFDTPLITFKNLEVLNSWIKKPEVLYKGKHKRTLWLSENGTNSKTYSEQDLKEQAAGFAYTWKKLKRLDGIDGFQWHNWFDHRGEGGLRIGLRKFPDDENDPGGKKPVWYVYQAADAENEDEVFDQYKELIGVDDWDQLNYLGEIDPELKSEPYRDIQADTWVAVDALGRELSAYKDCGPKKGNRFVGMFYFMTHINAGKPGPFDVAKIKAANPTSPQWGDGAHYWGEPEIGYYQNNDEWAIRRHAYQLADAGVDVIIFDVTNNKTFPEVYLPVCEVWREMRAQGEKTPDIAFLGSEIAVNKLWKDFYEKAMYPELWFMWKGKPLLLYGWHEQPQRNKMNSVHFSKDIQTFFSLRQSWAWTSLPWYDDGKDEWPWVDHFPQTIGWHEDPDRAENVPVSVAQHPLSNIGRSFHNFHQPETDEFDLTPFTNQGLYFQEQWNRAIEVDPEFVFVTGWNEWSAGKQVMGEDISANLQKWSFYPGAHLGRAGKPIKTGDTYFIDQYNQEFSRDIEPMKGGHSDNYYYQLIDNVRKYKGVNKPVKAGIEKTIDLSGTFDQWDDVTAVYYDHIGDVAHRNFLGDRQAGQYVNITGRNDIVECKVARDQEKVYFYVKTDKELTNHTGKNWMCLYLNTDQNYSTGWEGYDFLVNEEVLDAQKTTIKSFAKGKWKKVGEVNYRYQGKELMLAIQKSVLGENELAFDFHWADNIQHAMDINEFFINGDSAPERRSNYRFEE